MTEESTCSSIFVRVGEYDRFNKTDCVEVTNLEYEVECADEPVDFTVTEVTSHPLYNSSTHSKITGRHPENNIALIRVDAEIKYTGKTLRNTKITLLTTINIPIYRVFSPY